MLPKTGHSCQRKGPRGHEVGAGLSATEIIKAARVDPCISAGEIKTVFISAESRHAISSRGFLSGPIWDHKLIVTCDKLTCEESDKFRSEFSWPRGTDDGQGRRASLPAAACPPLSEASAKRPCLPRSLHSPTPFPDGCVNSSRFLLLPPQINSCELLSRGAVHLEGTKLLFYRGLCLGPQGLPVKQPTGQAEHCRWPECLKVRGCRCGDPQGQASPDVRWGEWSGPQP